MFALVSHAFLLENPPLERFCLCPCSDMTLHSMRMQIVEVSKKKRLGLAHGTLSGSFRFLPKPQELGHNWISVGPNFHEKMYILTSSGFR